MSADGAPTVPVAVVGNVAQARAWRADPGGAWEHIEPVAR